GSASQMVAGPSSIRDKIRFWQSRRATRNATVRGRNQACFGDFVTMAIAESREARGRRVGVRSALRQRAQSYAAALVLTLLFLGARLPSPLYVIYRDELHFSQVMLTLIYAVYFGAAMATALLLGRISDEIGRRVAIFAAVALSIGASLVFIFADSLEMLFVGRLLSGLALPLASGAGTA